MITAARYTLIIFAVFVMGIYLPMLADLGFGERTLRTQLFFSPVAQKFVWRDKMPKGAEINPDEKHHTQFLLTDEDGNKYKRQEFEKLLPFIYYKNMELWGLLPIEVNGESFDKKVIKKNRQVVELKPAQILGNAPDDDIYPLIDSVPRGVRLVFPDDRFRIGDEMEFINADFNVRDDKLTALFTNALKDKGFQFPGKFVGGKPSVLKPFDEAVFLTDARGALFHVKRAKGEPVVVKTNVAPEAGVRFIKVSESKRREFYGVMLSNDDKLYLMTYDNYKLIPLNLKDYSSSTMDFKMIINPVYRTAVYSDEKIIRASVMDREYNLIKTFEHVMPGTIPTKGQEFMKYLLPFRVNLEDHTSGYINFDYKCFADKSIYFSLLCVLLYIVAVFRNKDKRGKAIIADAILIVLTGVYGLIAALILPPTK